MNLAAYDGRMTDTDARTETGDARDLVRGLDADQRRAVTTTAPLLAVIAGAGSGKTAVLTRRVAWRCLHGDADPMHTAVVTFTRQAAAELRRRLKTLGIRETVVAGTFHAISLSLLQQHWERIGRRAPTVVQDRRRLIGEVLGPRRTASIDELASEIDWARARNLSARAYEPAAKRAQRTSKAAPTEVARVMSDLEQLKTERGIIDLDDLLSLVVDAARQDREFADILRWRLRHLYVDEAQDMNPLQREVLDVWRGGRDDLTLVGDPSQSIYGFNGSDPSILLRLEEYFPGIEVVRLDTNYRCTPQIVRAGMTTLAHLDTSVPALRSGRTDGSPVTTYGFDDESSEAHGVARILDRIRSPHEPWQRFAVLARTNAQLPIVRSALEAASIPVRLSGSNHDDPLQQCIRAVGELPSRSRLASWARDARLPTLPVSEAPTPDASGDDRSLPDVRTAELRVAAAVEEFLSDGGTDGRSFLAWVRTQRPFDDASSAQGVDLLTFHAAKGREWDTVVLIGCEDGLIPHTSARTPFARDEEVRLAYVAVTRAADRLILTHARSRKGRRRTRSPLIEGLSVAEESSPPTPEFLLGLSRRRAERELADRAGVDSSVFEELVEWRTHAARVSGVDPLLICPQDVLSELARIQPTQLDQLRSIPGLGAPLVARAGDAILAAISRGISRQRADDHDRESRTSPA